MAALFMQAHPTIPGAFQISSDGETWTTFGSNPGIVSPTPVYTSGSPTTNSTGQNVQVYVTTGTPTFQKNGHNIGTQTLILLAPGDVLTPTGAGSWTWFTF